MRTYLAVCVLFLFAFLTAITTSARCARLNTCAVTERVCGRSKFSNRCYKFQNICHLDAANTNQRPTPEAPFEVVDPNFCDGIALDTIGWCAYVRWPGPGYPDDGNVNGGSNGFDARYIGR